jgi:hypothetical protein
MDLPRLGDMSAGPKQARPPRPAAPAGLGAWSSAHRSSAT